MRNHPKKGSPEAFAWARRMQAARKSRGRAASNPRGSKPAKAKLIWHVHAGGTGAPEGKYGYTAQTEVGSYHISPAATKTGRMVGYRIMFADDKGMGINENGGLWAEIYHVVSTPNQAKQRAMWHYEFARKKAWGENPGAAYHEAEAVAEEATERRAAQKGKVTQAAFHRGKAAAHRQSEAKARELRMNPIAVFGNPGQHISARVEGVVYNRCIEIRAEKTTHKPGFYRHPFNKKSRVEILALDNGALLIHSKAGERLWGVDDEL